MAHALESGFFGDNKAAWHGLGVVIEEDTVKSDRAIELAGLNWLVEKRPLQYPVPNPNYNPPTISEEDMEDAEKLAAYEVELAAYEEIVPEFISMDIRGKFANVRNTDNAFLGEVGDRYNILQNREAFEFGDALVDSGDAKWHTAGSLHGGSTVWMLMKLPEDIVVGGMEDERIEQYILISNSHDGSSAITAAVTPVRVVCQNTLSLALQGNHRKFKVRHTKTMEGRLHEARQTLELTFSYGKRIQEIGESLLNEKMSKSDFVAWMDAFIPMPKPVYEADENGNILGEKKQRGATMREALREEISDIYYKAPNLENVRGTKYAAWQALTEWSDHHAKGRQQEGKTPKEENRFLRIVDGAPLVQKGFEVLV